LKIQQVVAISHKFEARLLWEPIISVCETRPTKIKYKRGLFSASAETIVSCSSMAFLGPLRPLTPAVFSMQLIDRTLAEIGVPGELVFEVDTDHFGLLGHRDNIEMLGAIKRLIRSALNWAVFRRESLSPSPPPSQNSPTRGGAVEVVDDVLSDDVWVIPGQPIGQQRALLAFDEVAPHADTGEP
jgi:hypothetical protein